MYEGTRQPRVLMVGGAPKRLAECAVSWRGCWWEMIPPQFAAMVGSGDEAMRIDRRAVDALVEKMAEFDVVWCESSELVVLYLEYARRALRMPPTIALEVEGLVRLRRVLRSLPEGEAAQVWSELATTSRIAWVAASDQQHAVLLDAGIDADNVHRIDAAAFVFQLMLVDSAERLRPDPLGSDEHLAPAVPRDVVLVPGLGRRDLATWLSAAALLPDVPFVSVGAPADELAAVRQRAGLPELPNVSSVGYLPLEEFIAAIRRSRSCVVCLEPGDGDGGHTTTCIAQAIGVPVIASRVPGVIDYVQGDHSARLVPPGDARALATAIRWLWEDATERARLIRGGLAFERERNEATGRAWSALIDEMLALR